jgi:hypothetical protein
MKKVLTILVILCLTFTTLAHAGDFYPAKVKDISDRNYEPAVIDLLDNAKESIVMSMYILIPSEKGPVGLLVNDLAEALERGVEVDIYINTKARQSEGAKGVRQELRDLLESKGARIHEVDSNYRLHDKLIIVDKRFVVEGSHNWSVSALKSNFESSSLIDSPALAEVKLRRVRSLRLEAEKPRRPAVKREVRETSKVELKTALVEDKGLLTRMLGTHDDRSMMIYLLLVREALNWQYPDEADLPVTEFPVSLEALAQDIGLSDGWTNTAKRRQVIKTLRKLDDNYGLIEADFTYGKDAWVVIKDISGGSFPVKSAFFDPAYLRSLSTSAKFVYLIKALLASEGGSLDDHTRRDISRRFHIGQRTLRNGIKELGE